MQSAVIEANPDLANQVVELRAAHPQVTDRQAELVDRIAVTGESIHAACGQIGADSSWAYKVLRRKHVLDYAYDVGKALMGLSALQAAHRMRTLLDARSQHVQLEAAKDILDRAGLRADAGSQGQAASIEIVLNLGAQGAPSNRRNP